MNNIAYTNGAAALSHDELNSLESRLCAFLTKGKYRTAAIFGEKSPAVFAAIRACLKAGVCYIPVEPTLPEERRRIMLRYADIVLFDEEKPQCGVPCIEIAAAAAGCEPAAELPDIADSSAAYIIFTSGTTGEPKGIKVSSRNLKCFSDWLLALPAIATENPRVVLNQARFSFDLSIADICCSLFGGMSVAAINNDMLTDFPRLFSFMRESEAEMAVLTPSFAEMCLCDKAFSASLMPKLRVIFFCGEVLKAATARELFARFPAARIINAYGPTEATCAVCACEITGEMTSGALPVGDVSAAASAIHIHSPDETGMGEIVICGDSVAQYLGEAGGFSHYNGERCYYTGDLGYIRDRMLYFCGRRDRQVKIMGHRIEPADIESNLCEISGVKCAVVTVETVGGYPVITAHVVAECGITPEQIRRLLKTRLPDYMIPRKIRLTDSIPLSDHGKTDTGAPL